jgi:UDPglucose 6-dehydrogenase
MTRIAIVGGGVVGTASAQGFAAHGHEVTIFDTNPERVEALRSLGLNAAVEIDLQGPSGFVFLTLPTPATPGVGYDLSSFAAGVAAAGTALRTANSFHVIVVRSTVPPRTTDGLVVPLLEEHSERKIGPDFAVAAAPEFLRENSALSDFLSPRMTVIATRDDKALTGLAELFRPYGGSMHTFADPLVAEVIKLAHNTFNATKISFWNEMWQLCVALRLDAEEIATTVAYSAEGSTNPLYGIRGGTPYAGSCLSKDVEGLLSFGRKMGLDMPLTRSTQQVNNEMERLQCRSE